MRNTHKAITFLINDNGCHECTSHAVDSCGYPRTGRNGFNRLNRWVHWKNTGERPEEVMHTCDNPKCINPDHLKSGTHLLNMQDMNDKGRHGMLGKKHTQDTKNKMSSQRKGELHPRTKLSNLDVRWIKMWRNLGYKVKDIAKVFKVTTNVIYKITSGKTFKESDLIVR